MLQKNYFMVFERYIPELKKYDSISFLHQTMASGQPLKIVQRHMAHPVVANSSKSDFGLSTDPPSVLYTFPLNNPAHAFQYKEYMATNRHYINLCHKIIVNFIYSEQI